MKASTSTLVNSIRNSLLAIIIGLFANPVFSQKQVKKTSQQWIQSYQEAKLNSKWTLLLDGGFRWREGFKENSAYIVRAGVGYSILPNLRVSTGMAHMGFYVNNKIIRHEYRPYQDIQYKAPIGKIALTNRFRIEERFFKEKSNLISANLSDFNFRFRYQIMVGIPLFQLSEKNLNRKLILNIGDEIFINAGKQVTTQVFDQNRFLISPTLQWNKELSISFTYNTQFNSTPVSDHYVLNRIAWLQIRFNPDLTKKPNSN